MNLESAQNEGGITRESKIISALTIFCVTAAFACFALIVVPNALNRAKASPVAASQTPRATIASIISSTSPAYATAQPSPSQASEEPKEPLGRGPEDLKMLPVNVQNSPESGDTPAGGNGLAIDEPLQSDALAMKTPSRETPTANLQQDSDEYLESEESQAPALQKPSGKSQVELTIHRPSSIAIRETSALDRNDAIKSKPWIIPPDELVPDVNFWRDIYSKYDKNQVVLHNPDDLRIVYGVVDLTAIDKDPRLSAIEKEQKRERLIDEQRQYVKEILLKLSENPSSSKLSEDEWRIKQVFAKAPGAPSFKRAAEVSGVRSQTGQKDKFIQGLKYSGRYLGEIEKIYEQYGLPRELTRLIFVESMFNLRAKSSVGASGIWQFMPGTGKLYVKMNDVQDERNDPIAASHASAKLLRQNFDALGTWPLAINAYNAGRGRLAQAVSMLGTKDIAKIVRNFKHSAYGFASRNFFMEYLAALDVAEHAERYFGPITFDEPLRFETVVIPRDLSLPDLASAGKITIDTIEELNPSISNKVLTGKKQLPAGFRLRLPEGYGETIYAKALRAPKGKSGPVRHVVVKGEDLNSIAQYYGISADNIRKANRGISMKPSVGQVIIIPF